ncbi:hypothetical protein DMENIID0001_122180 [Sergentomyia squamirostris]
MYLTKFIFIVSILIICVQSKSIPGLGNMDNLMSGLLPDIIHKQIQRQGVYNFAPETPMGNVKQTQSQNQKTDVLVGEAEEVETASP